MSETKLKEIGRVQATDSQELVISEEYNGKSLTGWLVGKYVTSEKYTGWGRGGINIPEEELVNFLSLFSSDDLRGALDKAVEREKKEKEARRNGS